jgi:hypothetical protein
VRPGFLETGANSFSSPIALSSDDLPTFRAADERDFGACRREPADIDLGSEKL